jgi:hypothetical protein
VFEKRVLRRIFGPKRDGGWRTLHNDERCNLHFSPNVIIMKEDEMGRECSTHCSEEESIQGFGLKARRQETTSKTLQLFLEK